MESVLIHKVIVILICAIGIWLAFWVYFTNRKSNVHRTFLLWSIFLLTWIICSHFGAYSTQISLSTLFFKLTFGAVFLFIISTYFFSVYFPREEKRYPILDKSVLILGVVFCFLSIFTNLLVKSVEIEKWGANTILGKGAFLFYGAIILGTFLIIGQLLKKYFLLSKEEKLRVQYFLVGVFIFSFLNLIFNIFLKLWTGSTQYYYFGNYSAIFLFGFTAYAIIKQRLFEVKVILTQILVGVMGLVLLVLPFVIKTTLPMKILMVGVFLVYCFIGYLLIKSTLREVRQKEILEEKVKERTKELQIAYKKLQTAYKEIKEKKEDLEKFYKLTVGRELRMIELKQKIKELEEKMKEKEKEAKF